MKRGACFSGFLLGMLTVFFQAVPAMSSFETFQPEHVSWRLEGYEIYADNRIYRLTGAWRRKMITDAGIGEVKAYNYIYDVSVHGRYMPREQVFYEHLKIRLVREEYDDEFVPPEGIWHITTTGTAASDPWLWPSKAIIRSVTAQYTGGFATLSADDAYAQFTFPLPLTFNSLTEAERKALRVEESSAPLADCRDIGEVPTIRSPSPGEVFDSKRLHVWAEIDCRFDDYSSNLFEVELQWYEPVEVSDPKVLRSTDWNFRAYPNQPEILLDMQPDANKYEYKSWGSGYLDLPMEGRYRLRVRSQAMAVKNNVASTVTSNWTDWLGFWSGKITTLGGEGALSALPDLAVRRFVSRVYEAGEPWPDGTVMNERYFYFQWNIRNMGASASPATELRVECYAGTPDPCPEDFANILPVDALEPGVLQKKYYLSPAPDSRVEYRFRVIVDPKGEITEGSEKNNYFYSTFSSEGPVIGAAGKEWLGRDPAAGSGQEGMSAAAKGAFGAKVPKQSGKDGGQASGMKKSSDLAKKQASLRDSSAFGKTSLSRDQRMKDRKQGFCALGFKPLSTDPRSPKDGEPFDLVIPFENIGSDDCLPSQEYDLFCHVDSGPGPCPFIQESRKLQTRVGPGESTTIHITGATAPRGRYTVKVGPKDMGPGSPQVIYLTVGPVVDPASVDKKIGKKKGAVDPDKAPKEMQQKESGEEGVKVPSSGSKLQSR